MKAAIALVTLCLAGGPAAGAPTAPMAIFAPYVGAWACTEHIDGQPDRVSAFRFDLDPVLLRETIVVPKSKALPNGDVTSASFAFDARKRRYVETEMGGNAVWYASTAPAPAGGVFHWTDVAAAVPLSHWDITLPSHGAFTIAAYDKAQDRRPNYRAACRRKGA